MSNRTEVLLLALWALAVTALVYVATGKPSLGIDDAQIFFTYAQNLAAGKGLLYSPGVPPAEGYTSSLWMAICALMFWMRANEVGVLIVSFLLLLMTQILVFGVIDRLLPDARSGAAKLIYLALVTTSPAYLSWSTITLMDTGIWCMLLTALVCVVLFPPATTSGWIGTGVVCALAQLTRPEATVIVPALLALIWLKLRAQSCATAPVWWVLFVFVATSLALTLFRIAYFGYALPSTYYAKVSGSTWYNLKLGAGYLARFVLGGNIALIAALVCVLFGGRLLGRLLRAPLARSLPTITNGLYDACVLLGAIGLLLLGLPVSVGGDHFSLSRFYQPAWPTLCLLLTCLTVRLFASDRFARLRTRVWLAPVGVTCLAALLSFTSLKDSWLGIARHGSPLAPEFMAGANGKQIGKALDAVFARSHTAPPTIGVVAAGGIARTYRGPIIDLMGLNNAYIAHFPGDRMGVKDHAAFEKAAFYHLNVDAVISKPEYSWDDFVLKGLFHDPKFTSEWRYGVIYVKRHPQDQYAGFYSTRFLTSVEQDRELGFYEVKTFNKADGQWERVPARDAPGDAVESATGA